jgi:hypothetical protein
VLHTQARQQGEWCGDAQARTAGYGGEHQITVEQDGWAGAVWCSRTCTAENEVR